MFDSLILLLQFEIFNPFKPYEISQSYQSDQSISVLRGDEGNFHLYSNFKRNFCKQTAENLIRRRVLRRLIWFCTACRYAYMG